MKSRTFALRAFTLLLVSICIVSLSGLSQAKPPKVLIIQDELPQMKVLAEFLRDQGDLSCLSQISNLCPESCPHIRRS
jgi:hypothetical protein